VEHFKSQQLVQLIQVVVVVADLETQQRSHQADLQRNQAVQVLLLFATLVHNVVQAVRLLAQVGSQSIPSQHLAHTQLKDIT
jgi:hypothetical protein